MDGHRRGVIHADTFKGSINLASERFRFDLLQVALDRLGKQGGSAEAESGRQPCGAFEHIVWDRDGRLHRLSITGYNRPSYCILRCICQRFARRYTSRLISETGLRS